MAPRAGLQRNAVSAKRGPAQQLACKKAAARPLARRAHANATGRTETRTAALSQAIPDSCARRDPSGAAGRRTDRRLKAPPVVASRRPHRGSAHRPTPRRTLHTRVPRERRASRPRLTLVPPAAVAQDLPHEADAREEDGPEPAHPPVDPHAHGQQDPLELEAAALAPHEARPLVELPKKTCSS